MNGKTLIVLFITSSDNWQNEITKCKLRLIKKEAGAIKPKKVLLTQGRRLLPSLAETDSPPHLKQEVGRAPQ